MQIGTVIKKYNGFYYVQVHEKMLECKTRGKMKKERFSLYVGDQVQITPLTHNTGMIEHVEKRHSLLYRPLVANIDQVCMTFSAKSPDLNPLLIDRFLVLGEYSRLKIFICITKFEFAESETELLMERYRKIGYEILCVSAASNLGVDEVRSHLKNKTTVFAGPSGVGKSTLLNQIDVKFQLKTGGLSEKISRGKHTTRFAELLPLSDGGYVVDTPGFSFTEFQEINERDLSYCFPEFNAINDSCKFNTCIHLQEPQCAIKKAVQNGEIYEERYQSYLNVLAEIRDRKKAF